VNVQIYQHITGNEVGNPSEIEKKRSSSKVDYDKSYKIIAMCATGQTIPIT